MNINENDPFCFVKVFLDVEEMKYELYQSFDDHDEMTKLYWSMNADCLTYGEGWRIVMFDAPWTRVKEFYGDHLHVLVDTYKTFMVKDVFGNMNNLLKGAVSDIGLFACSLDDVEPIAEGKTVFTGGSMKNQMTHVLSDEELADKDTMISTGYEYRLAKPVD